MLQHKK